jgi:hypothetical protein
MILTRILYGVCFLFLITFYAIGAYWTVLTAWNGIEDLFWGFITLFFSFEGVKLISLGIFQILVSLLYGSFIYIFFVGSILSPLYSGKRLIRGNSKLPIGRKKI